MAKRKGTFAEDHVRRAEVREWPGPLVVRGRGEALCNELATKLLEEFERSGEHEFGFQVKVLIMADGTRHVVILGHREEY